MLQERQKPHIIDVYPDRPQYLPGQEVHITIEMHNPWDAEKEAVAYMSVLLLDETIFTEEKVVTLPANSSTKQVFSYLPPDYGWQGFGVETRLLIDSIEQDRLSTAFDVVIEWKKMPRYGFLSEFYKDDEDDVKDIRQMVKYHINVVQFYDWMYRHDNLIPAQDYFIDPLNRSLSLPAVRNKIDACHRYGMKTLAYGAVYGACNTFFQEHKDWALYCNNGKPQSFGDWLYIMNTAPESPWAKHIVGEFRKAVELLDFDGIHMDAYGWPKTAYALSEGKRKLERLEEHFPVLIQNTRKELESVKEDIGLFFNAVSNWPVEAVAAAELDSVYIEVWDPCERYFQLNQLILRARELGKKQVILAAYLSAFSDKQREEAIYVQKHNKPYDEKSAQNCFLLASAVIFASGGYHFFLGEYNGALTNNYYVDYGRISDNFARTVRNYYDFIVRYANLLYDFELSDVSYTHANGINDEYKFENGVFSSYGEPGKIWTIVHEKCGYKTISLINLNGIESDIWNEGKESRPISVQNIWVNVLVDEKVKGVFVASPDRNNGRAEELDCRYTEGMRGRYLRFRIPELDIWDFVYIKMDCGNDNWDE